MSEKTGVDDVRWNSHGRIRVTTLRPAERKFLAMRSARSLILPALAAVMIAACGGSTPSPAPSASLVPDEPTPVVPTASPADQDTSHWMRLSTWQAIPPQNLFGVTDTAVIDGDGVLVLPGAVLAIFPGPLVAPLFGRQVSDEGKAQILAWAEELGLLSGATDFTGGSSMPGAMTGRIELTVGDERLTLTGIPSDGMAIPDPQPGSPEAFTELWRRLADLPGNLNTELGPESPYTPAGYAVLVGAAPAPEPGMAGEVMVWPLDTPVNEFGTAVLSETGRCGLAVGEDGVAMGEALAKANQLTQWTATPETSATFGLTVRPIVWGEDPCAEVFGV
jgi:hypothetical protein